MKIAIFPNNSVLLSSLVRKNNHTPLIVFTPTDSDEKYDKNQPPFNMTWKNPIKGLKNTTLPTPSGVRGYMSLYDPIIDEAEAGIIIKEGQNSGMYNILNECILFGCFSCINSINETIYLLRKKDIPLLELDYPKSQDSLIEMIKKIDMFLKNPKKTDESVKSNKKISVDELKLIIDKEI